MFDRHETLKKYYRSELELWDWNWALLELESNERDSDGIAYLWIGTVYALTPSGKIYAPWTTNQTRSDVARDEAWWVALEEVAEQHECFVGSPDGADGDSVYIGKCFAKPDEDSMDGDHASALTSAGFGTDEDYGGYENGN